MTIELPPLPLYYPVGPNHFLFCPQLVKRWLPDTFINRDRAYLVNSKPTWKDSTIEMYRHVMWCMKTEQYNVQVQVFNGNKFLTLRGSAGTEKISILSTETMHFSLQNTTNFKWVRVPKMLFWVPHYTPIMLELCSMSTYYASIILHAFMLQKCKTPPYYAKA